MKLPDVIITAQYAEDPDCTGDSCVYIWSCSGQPFIKQAALQYNTRDFRFSPVSESDTIPLAEKTAHLLGHLAGLDHCPPGAAMIQCKKQMTENESNPVADAVMYAFSGNFIITEDDRKGLQAMYGVFASPIPASGAFRIRNSSDCTSGF